MTRTLAPTSIAVLVLGSILCPALAQTTTRVSVSSTGSQGNGPSSSPSFTPDAEFVAFESAASNLVAGDTNEATDIFLHNRSAGTTVRVSVDSAGAQGSSSSSSPVISANGEVIAFVSVASNLVSGDTNGATDIFARNVTSGMTVRASVGSGGIQSNATSSSPAISADGRFVAFASVATNLVPGDTNGFSDVFVHDLATGIVERVSVDPFGNQANNTSVEPSLSANGRFVAFTSTATNLGVVDTNGASDIYVFDRLNATAIRASVSSSGTQGNSFSDSARISNDGRFVTFASSATSLVTGDTNGMPDIFRRDTVTNVTSRLSLTSFGQQNTGSASSPSISSDAQFIAYRSVNGNILSSGTTSDWILCTSTGGVLLRVGTASGGLLSTSVDSLKVSPSGTWVAFGSPASTVVPGDTNGVQDVFISDLGGPPWVSYCLGDGTATGCPCANNSTVGTESGCVNSTGNAGRLVGSGYPNVSNDTFVLQGSGMNSGPCLYFQGTGQFAGGLGAVLGDGLRCAAGTVIRLEIVTNVGGSSQYPRVGDPLISVKGMCVPGAVRTYQVWYRDAASFCTPENYNLTNGVALAWRP